MKDFLYAIIIAFSFFTTIPLPMVEWTKKRIRFLPVLLPIVGVGIGLLGYFIYVLLEGTNLADYSKAVIMVLFYLFITGGLHMDGLMDTADAYFSRKSKEEKLVIMKDSRVGAFAVMSLISLLLIKTVFFYEIFTIYTSFGVTLLLLFIPILSRITQSLMLCLFPYAKEDGLAVMYRQGAGKATLYILVSYFIFACGLVYLLLRLKGLALPCGLILFTVFYYFSSKKNFGGITGDIVGAYVELAEALMLGILAIVI